MRFEEYFWISEKNAWRVSDLGWERLHTDAAAGKITDFDRKALVGTAVIEHGVPHYGEVWAMVEGLREDWELWQFTSLWTGEESRHSFALKHACDELGLQAELAPDLSAVSHFRFAETQKRNCPSDCYRTVPGMLTYTVIQELATHKFYSIAAKRTSSPFLRELFTLIAGDEMRHHVFYRDALKRLHGESKDSAWYSDRVFEAVRAFKMPHLYYGLQMEFFENGDWGMGTVAKLAFKAQLARCFGFDASLIARLVSSGADAELSARRTVVAPTG